MEHKLKQFILALVFLYFLKLMVVLPSFSDALVFASLVGSACYILFKEQSKFHKELQDKIKEQDSKLEVFSEKIEKLNTKLAGLSVGQSLRK